MDQDQNKEITQLKKGENRKRRKYSKIGFMAVYGSMEAPKKRGFFDSEIYVKPQVHLDEKVQIERGPEVDNAGNYADCCKPRRYKKRRYCCPGKRRYKAKSGQRCCTGKYNSNKINLCNRNWSRLSIHPFINFLRCYRKRFSKETPPGEIARKGRCEWRRLSCRGKQKYYEQAKRARIRGYRT